MLICSLIQKKQLPPAPQNNILPKKQKKRKNILQSRKFSIFAA
jgi:hypothetical protein